MMRSIVVMAAVCCLGVAACSDSADNSASGDAFSVMNSLDLLPASSVSGQDPVQIYLADVAGAGEAVGVTPPADGSDTDALFAWLAPLTGPEAEEVFVPLPELFSQQVTATEAFDDELGFDITDVASFVEVSRPPQRLTVMALDDDAEPITDGNDEIVSVGEGEDGETSLENATEVRPLGRPLRLAARDDLVAVGLSSDTVAEWAGDDTDSVSDDAAFADVAAGLDGAGVTSAVLYRGDFSALTAVGDAATPAVVASFEADLGDIASFSTVGIGWTASDPAGVVVYGFDSAEAAESSVESLQRLYEDPTLGGGPPVPELVDLVEIVAEDNVVIATIEFDSRPQVLFDMLVRRAIVFAHP